jgi:hypothetical protein
MNQYAVFSFVTDRTRDLAVPVGVAAWSAEEDDLLGPAPLDLGHELLLS